MRFRLTKLCYPLVRLASLFAISIATLSIQASTPTENLIDVLVVYNEEAEDYFGGTDGVQASVIGIIAFANLAF